MADIKISQLTSGAALTGTEQVPVVQSGTTVKTTTQAIANLATGVQGVTGFGVDNTDPVNPIVNKFTTNANLTATGTNRATAAAITSVYTRVNNGGANTGVILPELTNVGDTYYIYNTTDTVKKFYADTYQDVYVNGILVNTFTNGIVLLPYTIYSFTCMVGGIISMNQPQVAPCKYYTALITQTSTNAPVETILNNTLGDIPVWSYVSVGVYRLTLAGAFPAGKVFINPSFPVGYIDGAGTKGYFSIVRQSDNVIQITVVDDAGTTPKQGEFTNNSVLNLDLRVYN